MSWPNGTTKEELKEYDRKLKKSVKNYYKNRMWRTLGENIKKQKE